jgi:hypothetical protein
MSVVSSNLSPLLASSALFAWVDWHPDPTAEMSARAASAKKADGASDDLNRSSR